VTEIKIEIDDDMWDEIINLELDDKFSEFTIDMWRALCEDVRGALESGETELCVRTGYVMHVLTPKSGANKSLEMIAHPERFDPVTGKRISPETIYDTAETHPGVNPAFHPPPDEGEVDDEELKGHLLARPLLNPNEAGVIGKPVGGYPALCFIIPRVGTNIIWSRAYIDKMSPMYLEDEPLKLSIARAEMPHLFEGGKLKIPRRLKRVARLGRFD